ncbi:DUF1015 domain-containing protein, partial [bacterium]|nr:DUF1015 domain-containing protein [bacterium]
MVIFKPFTGIRFAPTPTLGSQLSPPYDVISSQEQDALYQQHPHNIIRIDYGKTDPHIPPHETVYTRAHQQLSEWLQSGVLQRDSVPSFYVYRHTYALPNGSQKQLTGVIGALQLHPFDARQVIPHENTMPGPIQDRLTLTHHCQTNLSPIYTLVDDPDHGLDHCLDQLTQVDPDMNADTPSGRYELWVVKSKQGIQTIMGIMTPRPVVIADGHHRYTTALHYQAWARQQQGVVDAESDYTLAFVASAQNDGITIYPTHRGVYQTTFFESDDWLERIQSVFQVDTCPSADHFLSQPYPMGT